MSRRWACGVAGELNSTYRSLPLFVAVEAKLKRQTVCVWIASIFRIERENRLYPSSIRTLFKPRKTRCRFPKSSNRRIADNQFGNKTEIKTFCISQLNFIKKSQSKIATKRPLAMAENRLRGRADQRSLQRKS